MQAHNVALKDLPNLLRDELRPRREDDPPRYLYALLDMGRIQGELRKEVTNRLRRSASQVPILDHPEFKQLKEHGPMLIYGLNLNGWKRDDNILLNEWGACDGDTVSAWIVSELDKAALRLHLSQTMFAWDLNKSRYLMRYYDPLITPVLHRLADKQWKTWFFGPIISWWYPVATPQEETWARFEGGGEAQSSEAPQLIITEELWDAFKEDPLPYCLLNIIEQKFPSRFSSDCYGVRLAKVEDVLASGRKYGLKASEDLTFYVLALFEEPGRANDPRWQGAVRMAATSEESLKTLLNNSGIYGTEQIS